MLWSARSSGGRVRINPEHRDFPSLIAEALDQLDALEMDPKRVAQVLGCSTTQLVRLLALEPRALAILNSDRARRGLHPLN
ncbi:MAG: hypothetical protein SFX72_08665 [Isosphaeraceae bacterium]|nr:hypothetical protein [Isosphaeraceae bacterium]